MDSALRDLNVLITGASGGIGGALAEAFAQEGCFLVLHAGSRLDPLRQHVATRPWADRAMCVGAELRDEHAVQAMFADACAQRGRIDVAVLNAGTWPAEDLPLHELSPERVREVIDVDLMGSIWTAAAFMRGMAQHGPRPDGRGASLCLIGSTAGRFGEPGHCAYAVAKAGLYGLLRTLKTELARIDPYARINMVEPGWTATPMARDALDRPGLLERIGRTMPLRQIARPEDIARAVLFLSSPGLARHVSGEVLVVAGGMDGRTLWDEHEVDADRIRRRLLED